MNKGDAHQLSANRAKHHQAGIHVQLMACQAKAVVSGHDQGAADPLLALLSRALLWRWHAPMPRQCIPCFRAKDRQKHRLDLV